jgi:hypothetical protein
MVLVVGIAQERSNIDRVTDAAERKRKADSNLVGEGSGEKTDHCEGGVQRGVGVIRSSWWRKKSVTP